MCQKLQMQKIEIIALYKDSQNVIERLQRRGVVELINIEDERLCQDKHKRKHRRI